MSAPAASLLARYQQRLASTPPPSAREDDAVRRSYRQAAAVLDCFSFQTLQPADPRLRHPDPRSLLFGDVHGVAAGSAEPRFALELPLRSAALRELGTRAAMRAAVACNPARPRTPLQLMWEGYLATGKLPPLDDLGFEELTQASQILAWLDGLDPKLPPLASAEPWLRRGRVYATFEHLVARDFTGRKKELAMLREHIGALPPTRGIEAAMHQLRSWIRLRPRPILAIHGVGGIGKSALIGRLLWEHAVADKDAQIPFAYLAFDQPSLRVEAPHTMLGEAATQLELQYPEMAPAFTRFREVVLKFRDAQGALQRGRAPSARRGERAKLSRAHGEELFQGFAELLQVVGSRQIDGRSLRAPVVLVFDTFEEVQHRDRESLDGFWRMLDQIQETYPPLRAIISGRAAVSTLGLPTPKLREELLGELAPADSVELLRRLGVADPAVARGLAEQLGGNPLTLRLAASVAAAEPRAVGAKGIDSLVTRRLLLFQVDEQVIQGQLYRRVLDHIHDDSVRRLAHPGMVLRRVDPQVILHVLAPVCLPSVRDAGEAQRIFEALQRENALVTTDTRDGALVYRADIRASLLRLLEQDRYDEVRRLRRAAIAYYAGLDGDIARGEELFHRLALGEDMPEVLDARWQDGVQSTLIAGLDEYPDTMKAWLASRTSLEVPRSVFANADIAQWERNTTRKVQLALADSQPERALELLGERNERNAGSPLYALEAKALLASPQRQDEARAVLERGIASLAGSTNRGRLAELLWLKAQAALLGTPPDPLEADANLASAQAALERAANPVPLIHILAQRLLLRRIHVAVYPEPDEALQRQLAARCEQLDLEQTYAAGIAATLAAEMLDEKVFPVARQRLDRVEKVLHVAPEPLRAILLTNEDLQGLDEFRQSWELADAQAAMAR